MLKKHTISIKHAFDGIAYAFKTQPNYRIHFALSILALILGWLVKISSSEFLVIVVMIFIGLSLETVNTAIEQATDAIDTSIREDIRIAKDVSAGAMLLFAIGATIIAAIIFIPKII